MDMTSFKKDLEMAMTLKGMKKSDVAKETGVHQSTLSLFLSGERQGISGDTVLKLWAFIYPPESPHADSEGRL